MTKHKSGCRSSFLISVAVFLFAGTIHAQLPAPAQEAFDKGVLAARQQEWLIAIESFEKARAAAPDASIIYFNLGLAESKLPGRELRAAAWLGAYLASSPNAQNAAAVKDLIAALQVKVDGNAFRLVQALQDVVYGTERERMFNSETDRVIDLWARAGNVAGALQYADTFRDPYYKNWAQRLIAGRQIAGGDLAGGHQTFLIAFRTLEQIKDSKERQSALHQFATAQAEAGDIAGAIETADRNKDPTTKYSSLSAIALAQARIGDAVGARKTLAAARETADRAGSPWKDYYKELVPNVEAMLSAPTAKTTAASATAQTVASTAAVSDWLKLLDNDLNRSPFLDLAGYLKSMPKAGNPQQLFDDLRDTTENFVKNRNAVNDMLKKVINN